MHDDRRHGHKGREFRRSGDAGFAAKPTPRHPLGAARAPAAAAGVFVAGLLAGWLLARRRR